MNQKQALVPKGPMDIRRIPLASSNYSLTSGWQVVKGPTGIETTTPKV